jgi:hypothetical protein
MKNQAPQARDETSVKGSGQRQTILDVQPKLNQPSTQLSLAH